MSRNILDGKKIIFIGNSYVFYGNAVIRIPLTELTQKARSNDKGYFYQICKACGADVSVTNWTFGGHGLSHIFGAPCAHNKECFGENHEDYLEERNFDYVVVSAGGGLGASKNIEADFNRIIDFFIKANPKVKFVCLGNLGAYGYSSYKYFLPEVLNYYKELEKKGVIIADWGTLVSDLILGNVTPEGAVLKYNKESFIVSRTENDGFHPNILSGYITALTLYCALTGESAVGKPYEFCSDASINQRCDFEYYIREFYCLNGGKTNFPSVFNSKEDMLGIQKLIDKYLERKPYRNFSFDTN